MSEQGQVKAAMHPMTPTVASILMRERGELIKTSRPGFVGPFVLVTTPALAWKQDGGPLQVLVSPHDTMQGEQRTRWLHVSVARIDDEVPTYEQMLKVRQTFLRPGDTAVQVYPSVHDQARVLRPNTLHLWARMDGSRPVPDFRMADGTL